MAQNEIKQTAKTVRTVGIIGAGVSGLSLAFYLQALSKAEGAKYDFDITIYEKEEIAGGDCRTYDVMCDDKRYDVSKTNYNRKVDMGVKDFNLAPASVLDNLMTMTGYDKGLPVDNTQSYNLYDSNKYTLDGKYNTTTDQLANIRNGINRMSTEGYSDWRSGKYEDKSILDYANEKSYPTEYIGMYLLPSVSAMYFCEGKPASISFSTVMSYYYYMEGYGKGNTSRRYFVGGSVTWIKSLLSKVTEKNAANVVYGKAVKVGVESAGPFVQVDSTTKKRFNIIIMANSAETALTSFTEGGFAPDEITKALKRFTYKDDYAVVHTDRRYLPYQTDSWRTYNIPIPQNMEHAGKYKILWIINRHQNDCVNSKYKDRYDNPQVLLSSNPETMPPDNLVLKKLSDKTSADAYFRTRNPAPPSAINQVGLLQGIYNTGSNFYGFYFVNGYATQTGLMEECVDHAYKIAQMICK